MAVHVVVEQHIARPPQDVAAFATDPANDTLWIGALKSVRELTDGPFGVGTRVERTASFLGSKIEYVLEIAALDPGEARPNALHQVAVPGDGHVRLRARRRRHAHDHRDRRRCIGLLRARGPAPVDAGQAAASPAISSV